MSKHVTDDSDVTLRVTDSQVYSALTLSGHKRKTGHAASVPGVLVSRSVGVCLDIDAV